MKYGHKERGGTAVFNKMSKFVAVGLAVALLLTLLPAAVLAGDGSKVWYVQKGGTGEKDGSSWEDAFATIQEAVDAAAPGDTVLVAGGTYAESVVINKEGLILKAGKSPAVKIDGGIRIAADNVMLADLSITGGARFSGEWAGVYLNRDTAGHKIINCQLSGDGSGRGILCGRDVSHVEIEDCQISNWRSGIYINPTEDAGILIKNNYIFDNSAGIGGNDYSRVIIRYNTIKDNEEGIGYSGEGKGPLVSDNNITGNAVGVKRYGSGDDDASALDAMRNWWGHASGPYHADWNKDGRGDKVEGNVAFDPWLRKAEDWQEVIPSGELKVKITPQTLNLRASGRWVMAKITLPAEYKAGEMKVSSVLLGLNGEKEGSAIETDWFFPAGKKLIAKFDRSAVAKILEPGEKVEVAVTVKCQAKNGGGKDKSVFVGTDTLRVISPGQPAKGKKADGCLGKEKMKVKEQEKVQIKKQERLCSEECANCQEKVKEKKQLKLQVHNLEKKGSGK